jgi:hypothetical protein
VDLDNVSLLVSKSMSVNMSTCVSMNVRLRDGDASSGREKN